MKLIELNDVSVQLEGKTILNHISFVVNAGEHTLITGPNGAGKTTLLKLLSREIHPFAGKGFVRIKGHERLSQTEARQWVAFVSQDLETKLIHDPSVRELVVSGSIGTLGITQFNPPEPNAWSKAEELILHFGLNSLAERNISTLSSGERKRAWIARSMAGQPKVIIMDEPDAHLDSQGLNMLKKDFLRIANLGVTIICASHRFTECFEPFTSLVKMANGKIVEPESKLERISLKVGSDFADYLLAMQKSPVYEAALETPTEYCPRLSQSVGCNVFLKREDKQPINSFKVRGAYHKIESLNSEERKCGIITASAGNHAQGVALSAQKLGIRAVIVVPKTTPEVKQDAIKELGATLILEGDNYDAAQSYASKLGEEKNLTYIHPFDDPDVIAGQGTLGIELLAQVSHLGAVFVPVGGGGLISGVGIAVKTLSPSTKVIGVEPEDSDAMHRSLQAGQRISLEKVGLLADGVAVLKVGEEPFRIAQKVVDEIILVSNDAICGAIKEIFEDRRAILEPAGALSYAGLKAYAARENAIGLNLAAIASGANVNFDRLRYVSERASVGEKREAIFACRIPEIQGSFLRFCEAIGNLQITEFNYRMADPQDAAVFVGIAIKARDEQIDLRNRLIESGYETLDLTSDELSTTHLRHIVGGQSVHAESERFFHFDFPERPGALLTFLKKLGGSWNISLFHYRSHGADRGRVLVGFEVLPGTEREFENFRESVGCDSAEVTNHLGLNLFIGKGKTLV